MINFILRYPNGTTFDMTDDVEHNSLRISGRCDEAFAVGSCRAFTTLDKNIPPYTLCEIDGKPYLCSSECTKYQNKNNLYVHNISILELTAILECFILGTKVLSRGNDKTKLSHILELINDKYGVHIMTTLTLENLLQTQTNDYVFGSGTTLFDVATQMMVRLNQRPKVLSVSYNNGQMQMSIDSIALSNNGTAYALDWNKITQHTLNQNTENYSKWLETEANNVVDRNNLTYDKFLTKRADETRLTLDNGKLYTTSKIESINKFEVVTLSSLEIRHLSGFTNFSQYIQTITSSGEVVYRDFASILNGESLLTWIQQIADSLNQFYQDTTLYQNLVAQCQAVGIDLETALNTPYIVSSGTPYTFTRSGSTVTDFEFILYPVGSSANVVKYVFTGTAIDITSHIVEKAEYEAMEYCIQPAYCYYTKGSNVIDGMHVTRNDDLWTAIANAIGGGYNGPMLQEALRDATITTPIQRSYTDTVTSLAVVISSSIIARDLLYNVEYVPINNPRMIEAKTDTPQNETAYKPFTRTYQVGASEIDYDRLVDSMKQYCDMLGKPELTIEYDITGVNTLPALAQKCNDPVSNTDYFLMSYEIVYHTTHTIMTLNLCKSYYKVAEAIGVAYQYNATRLPVEGIIERPVYALITGNNILASLNKLFVRLIFSPNSVSDKKIIISRVSIMQNGNKVVAYCEAEDQFSFGRKVAEYTNNNMTYSVVEYVPYGDSNNEADKVTIQLITIDEELNWEKSSNLPDGTAITEYTVLGETTIFLHKDPREKLTFTIEIK